TSVPTIASPSRQRPRIRNPVANSQWTCSAGGCIAVFQVLQHAGDDQEVEEQSDGEHEQRRLDDEPPEALIMWMEQGQPIGLHDGPDRRREHRQRPDRRDRARRPDSLTRYLEFAYELCVHDVLPWSNGSRGPRTPCPQAVTRSREAGELRTQRQ